VWASVFARAGKNGDGGTGVVGYPARKVLCWKKLLRFARLEAEGRLPPCGNPARAGRLRLHLLHCLYGSVAACGSDHRRV
jgi:hypothetical protein